MKSMNILVTGGAGYIGSHTALELLQAGHTVTVLDNYCNSSAIALQRVQQIVQEKVENRSCNLQTVQGDIRDFQLLTELFSSTQFDAVVHFAGLKAVGESVLKPLDYYENNVGGSLQLLRAMAAGNVKKIVFSSSATVYGEPDEMPIRESFPTAKPTNPYGSTKLMIENILLDLSAAQPEWSIAILRYFNPAGAHQSGRIGEDPLGIPNNLLPYVSQVAIGKLKKLSVFGGDYPTRDGTGVRDYIHVTDLALGHVAALDWLNQNTGTGIWNLGTGTGYSVLEIIRAFENASNKTVPFEIVARRPGDIPECWANPEKAARDLGWTAIQDLASMMKDTWNWQQKNPNGYLP